MRNVVVLCAVFALSCKKGKEPRDTTISWNTSIFRVDGHSLGEVHYRNGAIYISVDYIQFVSSIELGDPPKVVDTYKDFTVWDRMGDALLAEGSKSEIDLQLPMKLSYFRNEQPSLTKIGKLKIVMGDASEAFRVVTESGRGLTFTGTDTPGTGAKTIVFPGSKGAIAGPGKRLRDVDLVGAIGRAEKGTSMKCEYESIGERTIMVHDAVVALHDRRTGRVVDTVTVPASAGCPSSLRSTEFGTVLGDGPISPLASDIVKWFEANPRT